MNEVWRMEVSPPTNTPFWSLGYEFWYYVLFGLALFIRNRRWKWIALGAASLIAGPKILLLMPAWLIGVAAYRWRDAGAPARAVALLGLAGSLAVTAAVLLFVPALPCTPGFHPWYFSGAAISDFLGGLCWALVIWFFNQTFKGVSGTPFGYQSVRWLAGHTFSLYLYHAPIVVLLSAIFPPELLGPFGPVVLMAIFVVIIGLAAVTESQRPQWTKLFSWLWDRWLMPQRRNAARAVSDEGGAG
jgi:peptidoglycan/LPS O-acetylase OafA/YrhL